MNYMDIPILNIAQISRITGLGQYKLYRNANALSEADLEKLEKLKKGMEQVIAEVNNR